MTQRTLLASTVACVMAFGLQQPASGQDTSRTENRTDTRACVEAQVQKGAPVAECVNAAQVQCLEFKDASPAATECFMGFKERWGAMISARMKEIEAAAPANITSVAKIELKYDMMQNLLQCDRIEELAMLTQPDEAAIVWQRARCEATATGLVFVKLVLQSRGIE